MSPKPYDDASARSGQTPSNAPREGGDVDFGAFVSDSVQRSADRFKTGGTEQPAQAPQVERAQPAQQPIARSTSRRRDSDYWRRRVTNGDEQPSSEQSPQPAQRRGNRYLSRKDHQEQPVAPTGGGSGDGGGGRGTMLGRLQGDGGDNRRLILAGVIALILLLLLIWGLISLFGGDDTGTDVQPTATTVVEPGSTPTEPAGEDGQPTRPPAPTSTPEIPRGGDNQRGDAGPQASPTEIAQENLKSDIARSCTGHCLVRVDNGDQAQLLEDAGTRASWSEDSVAWVVATPTQVEALDAEADVVMVMDEPETYNLYIVKAPADGTDQALIREQGTVIDQTGRYWLLQWNSAPAIVKPLTDRGYAVFKVAPQPPAVIGTLRSMGPASQTNGWQLLEQIDASRIEHTISDLSGMGELDNSGLGTRYYTYPGNQIAADYLYQELESYGLRVWYEDFITWDGYLLVNVVGEIPGTDTSEMYGVMAHFDSFNKTNTRTAPGADDNASGLAATLEIARVLAGYQLTHPVRFAFVNAEEVGLLGSDAWARDLAKAKIPMRGVLNIDSVGSVRNRAWMITNGDPNSAYLQRLMTQVNDEYGLGEIIEHKDTDTIVADDNYVRAAGIPAIMIARELYGIAQYHHTDLDVMVNVSIPAVVDTTEIMLLTTWELAK